MSPCTGQSIRRFLQYVYTRSHNAVSKIISYVHVSSVDFVFKLFSGIQDFSKVVHMFISEFPLVVRIISKHLESFVDSVLYTDKATNTGKKYCQTLMFQITRTIITMVCFQTSILSRPKSKQEWCVKRMHKYRDKACWTSYCLQDTIHNRSTVPRWSLYLYQCR